MGVPGIGTAAAPVASVNGLVTPAAMSDRPDAPWLSVAIKSFTHFTIPAKSGLGSTRGVGGTHVALP